MSQVNHKESLAEWAQHKKISQNLYNKLTTIQQPCNAEQLLAMPRNRIVQLHKDLKATKMVEIYQLMTLSKIPQSKIHQDIENRHRLTTKQQRIINCAETKLQNLLKCINDIVNEMNKHEQQRDSDIALIHTTFASKAKIGTVWSNSRVTNHKSSLICEIDTICKEKNNVLLNIAGLENLEQLFQRRLEISSMYETLAMSELERQRNTRIPEGPNAMTKFTNTTNNLSKLAYHMHTGNKMIDKAVAEHNAYTVWESLIKKINIEYSYRIVVSIPSYVDLPVETKTKTKQVTQNNWAAQIKINRYKRII